MKRFIALCLGLLLAACAAPSGDGTATPAPLVKLREPAAPVLEPTAGQTLYRLDPTRSEARYRVREKFLRRIEGNMVVGAASRVTGELLLNLGNGTEDASAQLGQITVPADGFTTDSALRDDRVRKSYLETGTYPDILFTTEKVTGLPQTFTEGETYAVTLEGILSVKDTHARTTWKAEVSLQNDELLGSATTTILMSDFGVGPISLVGLLDTENEMALQLHFVAVPAETALSEQGVPEGQPNEIAFAAPPQRVEGAPEFFADVKPILESNCVACHANGQIGHSVWSLETARDAVRVADELALVTQSGYMPPWPPSDASPAFEHSRDLSQDSIDTLVAWANAGAPTDGPLDAPLDAAGGAGGVEVRTDKELLPDQPYTPAGNVSDDYRCFLIDPEVEGERFFTGYQLTPGNLNIVHHIILYGITEEGRAAAEERSGKDGRPGWTCFGDLGLPGIDSGIGVGWTPGEGAVAFPEGTGVPIDEDTLFVLQVHYNLAAGTGTDRSSARLQHSEPGEDLIPLTPLDLVAPVELPCPEGERTDLCTREHALADAAQFDPAARDFNDALLALCDKNLSSYQRQDPRNVTTDCDWRAPISGDVVAVYGHMHTLGRSFKIERNPDAPDARLLLDIPHWDFNWQSTYMLSDAIPVEEGDTLRITCTWDNAPQGGLVSTPLPGDPFANAASGLLSVAHAHEQVPEGSSRYVVWGEDTESEMCLGSLLIRPASAFVGVVPNLYGPEWKLGLEVLWIRLTRQFYWLLPLVAAVVVALITRGRYLRRSKSAP